MHYFQIHTTNSGIESQILNFVPIALSLRLILKSIQVSKNSSNFKNT